MKSRIVGILALLTFVIGILFSMLDESGEAPMRSASSYEKRGRRAAFLLLVELGREPELWKRAPALLPVGEHVLILPRAPDGPFDSDVDPLGALGQGNPPVEPVEIPPDPMIGGPRDLAHYRSFVVRGGILVCGHDPGVAEFLTDVIAAPAAGELEPSVATGTEREAGALPLTLASGEVVNVPTDTRVFDTPPAGSPVEPLAVTRDGRPALAQVKVGDGRVVVLPSLEFLDNDEIGEPGRALLFVRLVEALTAGAGDARILFDEYALGVWQADSATGLAFSRGPRGVTLHLLALLLLVVWRLATPRPFPRDPKPLEQVSPIARARARAGLFERAGRWDVLAQSLRRGVLTRVLERLRLRPRGRSVPVALDDPEAFETFAGEEIRRVVACSGGEPTVDSWTRALLSAPPSDAASLEKLSKELTRLEEATVARAERRSKKR